MMAQAFLACDGQVIVDTNGRPKCRNLDNTGNGQWLEYQSDAILNTELAIEDYDVLWSACVLFLILGFGIKVLRSTLKPNRG